ncbi:MAG: hypothetical protein JWQ71_1356 [Pedosphaera sp.]|nr:hypothetical protein [Pedosphaera sp.]
MHEAILTMGDYQCAFGFLATPGAKGILGYPKPFAEVAHLSWNARGVEHEETVHLSSVIPGSKAIGTLIITVYENRLAARFEAEPKISK